jgi:hypothetical protein
MLKPESIAERGLGGHPNHLHRSWETKNVQAAVPTACTLGSGSSVRSICGTTHTGVRQKPNPVAAALGSPQARSISLKDIDQDETNATGFVYLPDCSHRALRKLLKPLRTRSSAGVASERLLHGHRMFGNLPGRSGCRKFKHAAERMNGPE